MKRLFCRFFAPVLACVLLVSACTDLEATRADLSTMSATADARMADAAPEKQIQSPLIEEDAPWFGAEAIPAHSTQALPDELNADDALVLTFEKPLTLDQVASRIQAATNVRVMVDKATPPEGAGGAAPPAGQNGDVAEATFLPADGLEVTGGRMVWQGKLSNLLDQVGDRFDAEWRYTGNSIRISQEIVRTFMLHALAGSTGVTGSVKSATSADGSGGLPEQTVDTDSKLAVWDEIQKTIDTIIIGKARASYSPATGTITLAGYPSAVNAAEDYLRLQNKLRLRRIALQARVLSVRLRKEYDNNFDMDIVVREAFNGQPFVFSSSVGEAGDRAITSGILRDIPTDLGSRGTTQFVINALSAVSSHVGVEYSGNLVTLSDQPAPLQVATKRAYVARVSGSATDGAASATLEPGTIDIGLSMNILPRVIEEDRIMLRIALGITDLIELREFASGDASVQLPEVDTTGFLQNAVLRSGETLVLAGFEKKNANDTKDGIGNPSNFLLGGGETYGQGREIRVLLITATLLPEDPVNVVRR